MRDGIVSATFSKPIETTSVEGRFRLWDGATQIEGIVAVTGSNTTLEFTATRNLRGLGAFRAEIDQALESSDGVALGSVYQWHFATRDYEWEIPIAISNTALDESNGRIAVDSSGNALVVYGQFDGTRVNLLSRRYLAETASWTSAAQVEFNDGALLWFDADMSYNGIAVATWLQENGTGKYDLFGARFSPVAGWGTAQPLEADSNDISDYPAVSVAPDGSAMVVWLQSDGTRKNVWANHMNPSGSWDGAALVETGSGNATSCEVASAPDGSAIAVWTQVGTSLDIWSNRYVTNSWEQPALVDVSGTNASSPQIVFDGGGNATIAWIQCNGSCASAADAIVRRRMASGTWDAPVYLEASADLVRNLMISASPNGHVIAMWNGGPLAKALYSARYVPSIGWVQATLVATTGFGHSMAIDDYDHAAAIWGNSTASSIARFDGDTWSTFPLEPTASPINSYMAMTPRGEAAVVWTRYESYLVPYRVDAGLLR